MKYLGIDYGTKRIGLATSDEAGMIAFPFKTIEAGSGALAQVADIVKEERIEKIIIGESKNFKNERNSVMEDIEQFKKDIAELSGLLVEYEPEFLTSAQALRQAQGKQENIDLDASAAALILQGYLDRNAKKE